MTLPRFLLQYENQHSRIDTAIEECAENIVINALFSRIGAVPVCSDEKYLYCGKREFDTE